MVKLNIVHINTDDILGGAAKVAWRLAESQRAIGHNSVMLVGTQHDFSGHSYSFSKDQDPNTVEYCLKEGLLYYDYRGSHRLVDHPLVRNADLLHFHNLHGDYFNPFSIINLSHAKPTVWTLHDMQAITGHCAHSFSCEKWQFGCTDCPDLSLYASLQKDSSNRLWLDKKTIYDSSHLCIVAPSLWLGEKAKRSMLGKHPVHLIHNGVNTSIFKPYDKYEMRHELHLPSDAILIGGAAHLGVLDNPYKGGHFIFAAMEILNEKNNKCYFLNIGVGGPSKGNNIINVPAVEDEAQLAKLFSSLDLYLSTSLAENCPLVILEAMSCGLPVVTFATGGIPELVRNGIEGSVVEYKNLSNLIYSLDFLINNIDTRIMFGSNARARALELFDHKLISSRYEKLYQTVIKGFNMPESNAESTHNIPSMSTHEHTRSNHLSLPKISIVTPSFNQSEYLEECIESVLAQNYPNLEYIIMDGGSTDGSVEIIKKYEKHLTYWQSKPDGGHPNAVNEGFKLSTGEILGWLNSDDKLHPFALWKIAFVFHHNAHIEWLTSRISIWNNDGDLVYISEEPPHFSQRKYLNRDFDKPFIQQEATFWRRSLWDRAGGFVDPKLRLTFDPELWLRFFGFAQLYLIDSVIGGYRDTGKNTATLNQTELVSQLNNVISIYIQSNNKSLRSCTESVIKIMAINLEQFMTKYGHSPATISNIKCWSTYFDKLLGLVNGHYYNGQILVLPFIESEIAIFKNIENTNTNFNILCDRLNELLPMYHEIVSLNKHGLRELERGETDFALALFETALSLSPSGKDSMTLCNIGSCKLRLGHYQDAEKYFNSSLDVSPLNMKAVLEYHALLVKESRREDATKFLRDFSHFNPDEETVNALLSADNLKPCNHSYISGHEAQKAVTDAIMNQEIEARRDESLQDVFQYIETGAVNLLSVDCFDTLISRLTPEPINVFIEIGRRLAARGLLKSSISPLAFLKLRQEAEHQARKSALLTRHTDECTISEIYQHLEQIVSIPAEGVEIEIIVESEFCYMNPGIVELIRTFAKKYGKVAIVSDTYLSSVHLETILARNGFDLGLVDCIWTSSDHGCSKHNGGLFQVILGHYGSAPHQILHVGDNKKADIEVPKNIGINTLYYYRLDDLSGATIQKERIINHIRSYSASLDSVRVQASRFCSHLPVEDRGYYKIGSFLFGPLLARYADWVVGECRKEGVTTVLALMREAVVLGPMVERAAEAAGYPLKVTTFYASRSSMKLASLCKVTHQSLKTRIDKFGGNITFDEVLKMMGLSSEMMGFSDDVKNSVVPDMDALVHELTQGGIAQLIDKNSAELRVAALRYLQNNLAGAEKVIIVDLGYRGTIQRYMEDMIAFEGVTCQMIGCYFTTTQHASSQILAGSDIRAYMGGVGTEEFVVDCFRRHPEILEQSVCATIGSTEGYTILPNGDVEPRLGLSFSPEEENRKKKLIQEGIFSFQRRWLDIMLKKGFLINPEANVMLAEIDDYSRAILHRISAFPSHEEASLLGTLHHDDNNGADTGNQICNNYAREAFREHGYQGLINARPYWHDGVVALERPEWIDNFFQTWLYHACM